MRLIASASDGVVEVRQGRPDPGFIRKRGYDFSRGDAVLAAGRRIGPRELTLAAAAGHGELPVRRRPTVAILATGDELVAPGRVPGPGQIVSSIPLGVAALLVQAGADARLIGIARDLRRAIASRLASNRR